MELISHHQQVEFRKGQKSGTTCSTTSQNLSRCIHLGWIRHGLVHQGIFPGGSDGKVSAYNVGDLGSIPGSGRSPGEGNGNPLQYSYLENPMDGGTWLGYSPWGRKELYITERLHLFTRKDSESEWLVKDNLETNPITIKPKTSSHVAEQFSWVPLPYCSPLGLPFPAESLALSPHVSPGTIHFRVLDEPTFRPWKGSPFLQQYLCSFNDKYLLRASSGQSLLEA